MRFHHIGIACKNIDEDIASITRLHTVVKTSGVLFDKEQNAQVALLTLADGTNIELVAGEQVGAFLKKKISYYHICFEVGDINAEIDRLINENALVLSRPMPAVLFNNREVAFLSVSYGIIELLSSK